MCGGGGRSRRKTRHTKCDYSLDGGVLCQCGLNTIELTVLKYNRNRGRLFRVCAKPVGSPEKCETFYWSDELILPSESRMRKHAAYRRAQNPEDHASSDEDAEGESDSEAVVNSKKRKLEAQVVGTNAGYTLPVVGFGTVDQAELDLGEQETKGKRLFKERFKTEIDDLDSRFGIIENQPEGGGRVTRNRGKPTKSYKEFGYQLEDDDEVNLDEESVLEGSSSSKKIKLEEQLEIMKEENFPLDIPQDFSTLLHHQLPLPSFDSSPSFATPDATPPFFVKEEILEHSFDFSPSQPLEASSSPAYSFNVDTFKFSLSHTASQTDSKTVTQSTSQIVSPSMDSNDAPTTYEEALILIEQLKNELKDRNEGEVKIKNEFD